jgi:flagellar hook protein FlgE
MSFSLFYTGLAGLQANSNRLGVIGNNLANLNTIGFKSSRVTFSDIFSGAGGTGFNGAGNPMQVGRGVQIGSIDQLFSQGSFQSTGMITDLSIQGQGFFVLADSTGTQSFGRAGNFTFDKDGNLVTPAGGYVQGWTDRNANGNIPSSGQMANIQVPVGLVAPPQATTTLSNMTNLSADARVDDPLTALDEAQEFQVTTTVYDSLGARHNVTFSYTPADNATTPTGRLDHWTYSVTVPGEDVTGGTAGTPFEIDAGTVAFDSNGLLVTPAANVTLAVPAWTNGAAAQSVDWLLFDDANSGLLTGYSGASATSSTSQNGFGVGTLRALTIDQDGLVSGNFTNGSTLELAKIAMAVFRNPNGLIRNGANSLIETSSSGPATIGGANTAGRGEIIANSLELSNVDITQEFTEMIVSERGYQANSRIITTVDQILQEALSLKR